MAFPFVIKERDPASLSSTELQKLRQFFIDTLVFAQPNRTDDPIALQLAQISRVLGHSAGNEATVYDNGSAKSTASSAASSLTQQVERAITQVLGRSPGRGPDGFISALNSAFPTTSNGQVLMTPARSLVSLYSPAEANGLTGQLSVEQANLYRQASIIGQDALKVLNGLTPFDPKSDIDAVEALRSLVRSQIRSLIDEFGRLDEPRTQLVDSYFRTLLGRDGTGREDGSLYRLGEEAFLGRGVSDVPDVELKVLPITIEDETQVAGFELLLGYVDTLNKIWTAFKEAKKQTSTSIAGRYSERLSRASIMLPVIADSNASFTDALDSIGFPESERRSDSALFNTLTAPGDVVLTLDGQTLTAQFTELPDITVNDFDEWVDRFATLEAPSLLSTSGQFGLDFVTDQADTLFWTIGVVLLAVKPQSPVGDSNQTKLLGRMLSFERVQQTISELVFQLDTLADLGVGSVSVEQNGSNRA